MNTLIFTLEYPPFRGGVANYYGNLVKYWQEKNKIFVLKDNLISKKLPFLKWLPAELALRKTIKKYQINHVIVGHILPLGMAVWLCSKFCKIKYSVVLHGVDFSFATRTLRKTIITRLILNKADKIICANSYTAELVKQLLSDNISGKIIIVNPGIDECKESSIKYQELKNKYNLKNKLVLLSVGRLVKRKGFDKVIEAMPDVLKQIPNLVYVIIGDGPELKNLKLNKNVIIITDATDAERDSWYKACDIFIMPSRNINGDFEGFGIVYLEANLAGRPVIAGRSGGVADAVADGINGLMVDPENTAEISQAIVKLAIDSKLRLKLGEQGKHKAINDFNWQKQIDKIYQAII